MKAESKHLAEIIQQHNRAANVQVVFVDIEKYSNRRTLNQIAVIDAFTQSLNDALHSTAKEFVDYAQKNGLNFKTDVITIPTGDGAAVVFTFEGLPEVHLFFARSLLRSSHEARTPAGCTQFTEKGWCNCHPY